MQLVMTVASDRSSAIGLSTYIHTPHRADAHVGYNIELSAKVRSIGAEAVQVRPQVLSSWLWNDRHSIDEREQLALSPDVRTSTRC